MTFFHLDRRHGKIVSSIRRTFGFMDILYESSTLVSLFFVFQSMMMVMMRWVLCEIFFRSHTQDLRRSSITDDMDTKMRHSSEMTF